MGFRWSAVITILIAYLLVSQGFVDGEGLLYNLLNGAGSFLLMVNSLTLTKRDWPVAVFNAAWLIIATTALGKIFF